MEARATKDKHKDKAEISMDDEQWAEFIQWNERELEKFDRKLDPDRFKPQLISPQARNSKYADRLKTYWVAELITSQEDVVRFKNLEKVMLQLLDAFIKKYGEDKVEKWDVYVYPQGPYGWIDCRKDGKRYRAAVRFSTGLTGVIEFEWMERSHTA